MKTFEITQKIKIIVMVAFMLALLPACNKEVINDLSQKEMDSKTIETIVEQTNQLYLRSEVAGGDENTPFILANDGLIDEYDLKTEEVNLDQPLPYNRFIQCLVSVELTPEQSPLVRRAVLAYQLRNKNLIMKHRMAVAELNKAKELRRNYYLAQLRSGEINRREFVSKMTELRQRFVEALLSIKKSNATEFALSFRLLMKNLNEILDSSQWLRFTDCLRAANNQN